jgi:two-component system sensor histidine kinase RegB
MSAIPTDDTLSRDRLPRGKLSQARPVPATLSTWLPGQAELELADSDVGLRAQLRTLAHLRAAATGAMLLAIAILETQFVVALPMSALLAGLLLLFVSNVWLYSRAQSKQRITETEYFLHLVMDMLGFSYMIYWLGGAGHNPFADLYIVYVGMAALVLRRAYVVALALVGLGLYLLLRAEHHELLLAHPTFNYEQLEELAALTHFILFGTIVAYFGYRLSRTSHRITELSVRAREQDSRGEAAVNLAALAAGTAHEMGTPLTTVAMLVGDLRKCGLTEADREASLLAIANAVQACKHSLGDMVTAIGAHRLNESRRMPSRQMLEQLVDRFRPMRPNVPLVVTLACPETCLIETSAPLRQALMNLITNAADASPQGIELHLNCSLTETQIDVLDRGPGISDDVLAKLGQAIVTTKPAQAGNGVGVYLANMTISRLGGTLQYLKRDGGGTCARVTLPTSES